MEKPSRALLVAIALVVMIAISLHLTLWLDETCNVAGRRAYMKATGGIGCFEFWLNRYQGLVGNVLTAGVAGATLIWLARQLVAADKQVAASNKQAAAAAAQALRGILVDHYSDRAALQQMAGEVWSHAEAARSSNALPYDPGGFIDRCMVGEEITRAFVEWLVALELIQTRNTGGDLRDITNRIGRNLMNANGLASQLFDRRKEYEQSGRSEAMLTTWRYMVEEVVDNMREHLLSAQTEMNHGISATFTGAEATWLRIRAAEDVVVGVR